MVSNIISPPPAHLICKRPQTKYQIGLKIQESMKDIRAEIIEEMEQFVVENGLLSI